MKSHTEALAHALMLSITAPDEEKSAQALAIADQLAADLSETDVARAKKMAQALVDAGDGLQSARDELDTITESAKQAARDAAKAGVPEVHIAGVLGVDRMTVRKWLGKR